MRGGMRRISALAAVLALSMGMGTACTKKNKEGEAKSGDAAKTTAVQSGPSNKQLTIGMTQEFESMNPLIMTMAASSYVFGMVGRPLMVIDTKWNWQCELCTEVPTIENGLAKIVEEGGKKKLAVTWKLKEGMAWGDGKPVTGEDFRLAWEIGKSPNVSVGSKETYERIEALTVDAKNPLIFVTKFKEPRYDYYQLSMNPIPAHLEGPVWAKTKDQTGAYEKQTIYNKDPLNKGLYNGPYTVNELKLGSHVVVAKNPKWAGKEAAIEKIILKLIPNTQALEAGILSGTIDMISELGMTFDQAIAFDERVTADASTKGKYVTHFRDGLVYEHIDLNLRNPILKDVNVRQALVYAIDRDKLSMALFKGKQKKAVSNIHPLDPYFSDDVKKYPYDPAKASAMLEAAGWKKGADGIRAKDGKKLELTLMTTANNKTRELVQVFLQEEWKKVGAKISIKNEPARVYFGETVRKAKYEAMAMYAWISSPDAPPRGTLHSSEIPTKENGYSGQNSCGWANAKVDKLLEDVFLEFDFDKRKKMMAEIQKEYTTDVPVIPLYLRAQIATVPGNMNGFELSGHLFYSSLNVEKWSFTDVAAKTH